MIRNTFCHIPGIGPITEKRFWDNGLLSWDHLHHSTYRLSPRRRDRIHSHIEQSQVHLRERNLRHFAQSLPAGLHWRFIPEVRDSVAYVDIETTGLEPWAHSITTIALYDGRTIRTYVQGQNLDQFPSDCENFTVLVTYNGKCFDVPFMESHFGIRLPHVHIDLRYILKSLGYSGGLKGCEFQMGLDRGDLGGVDGFFAVLLWQEYQTTGDPRALETLLAYNVEDVVNLEHWMVMAYNLKLRGTPFEASHRLDVPARPEIPLRPDLGVIERMRGRFGI